MFRGEKGWNTQLDFVGDFLQGFFPPQATNKKNTQNTKKAVILGWKKQRFDKVHMFFVFNRHGMSVASKQDVNIAASEDSWPAYLIKDGRDGGEVKCSYYQV